MFGSTLFGITLLSALAPFVSAGHFKRMDMHRRHDELAHSASNASVELSSSNTSVALEKRQQSFRMRASLITPSDC
ncbi:uncharacterized protein B0H18DRAFT_992043, partial [Fomitopsis serialis]|uniref:uncharacterized protein n=1 Tax=Fomitopsis serialis TaxID=139415 RepID=UPI002007CC6C